MKRRLKTLPLDYVVIVVSGFILFWVSLNINGSKDYSKGLIESDAKGYYSWLPAIFIYHDLNFGYFNSIEKGKYFNPNLFYDYRLSHKGHTINKYYSGTAFCLMPFFLAGHLMTKIAGLEEDGYSMYYVRSVSFAGICYVLISLLLINLILKAFNITLRVRALVLAATLFGTNLFYYSVIEFGMSHVYSLAFISLFIWAVLKYIDSKGAGMLVLSALALGIIVIIRPVNILVLLTLPFVAGGRKATLSLISKIWKDKKQLPFALLVFTIIVSFQLLIFKIQCGDLFVYSYKKEGFNFCSPHIFDILFSYKKGLFLYTPMYLFSLAGLVYLWKHHRPRFWAWWFLFMPLLYIFSSWHNWYYGGSFSGRVFIDYLALFALLLGLSLSNIKSATLMTTMSAIVIALIVLCQVQTYQYRHGQIHWSEQNSEIYWKNFLRIDKLL